MADFSISRLDYWRHAIRPWWLVVSFFLLIWGVLGNLRQEFVSAADQERWRLPVLFPRIPWYWLVIVLLVITIIAILEGMFREHRKRMMVAQTQLDGNKTALENIAVRVIKIQIEGHSTDSPTPYIRFRVSILNCSAYPITIEDSIGGFVTFNRRRLHGELRRLSDWLIHESVANTGIAYLVFDLWLEAIDAAFLNEHSGMRGMEYYYNLENVEFMLVGGNPLSPKKQLLTFLGYKGVNRDGGLV